MTFDERFERFSAMRARVNRAFDGHLTRLDFRIAVGLMCFAGWASGPRASAPIYGVNFPFPHMAAVVTNPQGVMQAGVCVPTYNPWFVIQEKEFLDVR